MLRCSITLEIHTMKNKTLKKIVFDFFLQEKTDEDFEYFAKIEYKSDWKWAAFEYNKTGELPETRRQA